MLRRVLNLVFFLLVTGFLWWWKNVYPVEAVVKWYYTALAFTVTYFVFRFVLEELLSRQIKDDKLKYQFKKTFGILGWVVFIVLFIRIWVKNPQALLVAYGLIGAGMAVALQDVFKNFVGGITVFLTSPYKVGDRIEVNGEFGDVIDIGIMYSTVMEMREWVGGDQATGRICTIPNGWVLSYVVNNYTRDHKFIWDEIQLPITYDSDWKDAMKRILHIVKSETKTTAEEAEREISRIKQKFFVHKRDVQPNIFLQLTDNWIMFHIRYVVDAKNRRLVHNQITRLILEEVQKSKRIRIASTTLNIIGFPDVKVRR
jgi:small-conductance mechanosensitive channel